KKDPRKFYGAPNSIISADKPFLHVSNFSDTPIKIRDGEHLGSAFNPYEWLDKPSKFSKEELENLEKQANYVKSLSNNMDKPPREEPHPSLSQPTNGGPKGAQPPDDPTPTSKLLKEVDFAPDLSPDQKQQLEDVILKHQKAFGLDNRLGEYDANVTIKLKPNSKPISIPPYSASPKNREVI
ncbi:hypothetical protein SISNIDRAFT_396858, partial [Sistotremastrum niveocremeum HHB9708]